MRVLQILIVLLALGGIVDSSLALRIHNQDPLTAPPCAVSEHWDCGVVNHSRYAVFPAQTMDEDPSAPGPHKIHVPVALIGIFGYAAIAILAAFGHLWITLQAAEIGFGCAAMLSYLEAYVMQKWCIYCVWSQAIITAILLCTIAALILRHRAKRTFTVAP